MTVLRNVCVVALLLVIASFAPAAAAQTGNASLSGRVTDPQGSAVPHTSVEAINNATSVKIKSESNSDGLYYFSALPPGSYRIVVSKDGFKQIIEGQVSLHTQDSLTLNFALQVGSVSETVTVNANASTLETDNPAVSMTVTREFVENMPLNGRSLQDLIQLAPGTVSSQNGYYSIDGQRTDSNNYIVDGVSANLGGILNQAGPSQGGALAGNAPLQTVLGTTQSLASVDTLQEFTIQTSGYTAEYGRNPGGQVQFTTRSGTNDIHGTLFDYVRNTAFDANSYENDYYQQPKTAEHQNDFGGTVGGPLVIPKLYNGKDKTFFFFSYEGLRLLLPAFESEYVPTQAFRSWASPDVQPFLNATPLPNGPINQDGCTILNPMTGQPAACDALFTHGYSYPNNLDNISARIDQNFGNRFHVFLRYADTPSSQVSGAEQVYNLRLDTRTWTAGVTANISSSLLNDFHFNYTYDNEQEVYGLAALGGAVPWSRSLLIPAAYESAYATAGVYIQPDVGSLYVDSSYGGFGSKQHQYQIVDSLNWIRRNHAFKFGVDWRRLTPTFAYGAYDSQIQITSSADIQQGYASEQYTEANAPGRPIFDNFSIFVEDHWKITPRLSIDYGVRWEFNPPPGPSNGHYPITLTSSDLLTAQVAPIGTPPYKTQYDHFAPRFGFAWNAIPSHRYALTVRGGFGIFFDTGQSVIGESYADIYPFRASSPTLNQVPLPLSNAVLAPPSLNFPLTPPYSQLGVSSPDLTLPYTAQWNLSVDEALNERNTLTVSYVGNIGRRLLFSEYYTNVPGNPDFADGIEITNNASQSNYNALQVQDRGRIANGLDLVGSFTWAHARDNASNDYSTYAPLWGNADNDLRRVLNLALNYQIPTVESRGWMRALTHGWLVANRFSAQSGYPLDMTQTRIILPNGTFEQYRPDLVPGVPIYLHGSAADINGEPVPGNWRLNSAAFSPVPTDPTTGLPVRQGNLGRNFVRGPGFYTLNTALQRSFPIYERLHLLFRVEAFNILNHPNLDYPDTYLTDSTFGELINGTVRTIGVPNQLYAMGSSRSLQLSLKLQF